MEAAGRCEGLTRDGEPCKAKAVPGSRFCAFHDPAKAEAMAAGRKQGGKTSSKARNKPAGLVELPAELPLATVADVTVCVGAVMNGLRRGETDPKTANALFYGATVLLKALEGGELARQVAELTRMVEELRRVPGHTEAAGGAAAANPGGREGGTVAAAGASPGRPGADPPAGGDDAGPLAADVAPLFP